MGIFSFMDFAAKTIFSFVSLFERSEMALSYFSR